MDLPDIEAVSAAVHKSWMDGKRKSGISSRKAEDGEEMMKPYASLSEKQKEQDRATVRTVYQAIKSAGGSMFPSPKKKFPPKPAMDDLESPDPVEGKPAMDAEEAAESPAEESSEDYGAKLVADIETAGKSLGMDAATSRQAAGAFFKAAADCLGGGSDEGDTGQDYGTSEMPADDIAY